MTVRTRFAPSPTGYLHIGGVRTALFNWLFARQHGGQFVLRIDDTDQNRNVEAALQPILDGFRWLGLDWDEGPEVGGPYAPYFQSERGDFYKNAVEKMLASGSAYRDYATEEEFEAERQASRQEGRPYSRQWMAETDADAARYEGEGRKATVRLKMPREGVCRVSDLVLGDKEFAWAGESDAAIQRSDGTCMYHLANVVDDHALAITHVIRAQEHFSNTPRQMFIAQSLGFEPPRYAHLPVVAEPGSKKKLSKRNIEQYLKNRDFKKIYDHGAAIAEKIGRKVDAATFNPVIVDFYRDTGYLADALVNYLLLLGWSFDGEREAFTRQEMIDCFSLDRVIKGSASFDPQKLFAFEQRHFNALPAKQKTPLCLRFLQAAGLVEEPTPCDVGPYLAQIVEAAGDRLVVAGDILGFADFFTADDQLSYDEKTWEKRLIKPEGARDLLARFREQLANATAFDAASLETLLKDFIAAEEKKIGDIIHALRVAVTGQGVGFGMFETLAILGQERCLRRIDRALERANS
ncbi:glutamate--tRNA ligase [Lignipirellula cremea]|uniref:Glutamate--tRNA ligase n=1 Tax=Lignipirellula cremea TaxID=2528010 RepID=A0A518DSV4_9BACT|nr:glutamate--tRNA ligase [Lignipirellula cremea]QDU94917.1 Glutamate--tRNA ligase 1 [Lignipirellula cremea]